MAGVEGPVSVNVQAYDGRFSAKDVLLELSSMGVVAGADDGEPVRLRSKAPTAQRRVLFLDGDFAGETRTVDVGADGVFAGRFVKTWRNGERVHYEVEYRVEEVRLGFGDTVFLGFVPDSECPSWPQRVADALAFIEGESKAYANREREAEGRRREAEDREFRRQEWERQRSYERQAAEAEAASHEKFLKVRRAQKQAQEARRRFQPPHIDQ